MGNPVGWFEIYVQDMERAKAFYEVVFGLKLAKMACRAWRCGRPGQEKADGNSGAPIRMQGPQSGGGIHKGKTSIGGHGYFALVLDTEGNMIGLHSLPEGHR